MKTKIIKQIPILCFCLIMALAIDWTIIRITLFVLDPVKQFNVAEINVAKADTEEMPMKLWVLNEVYKSGLNPEEVECIIDNESHWNEEAISKTNDFGLWQINIIHKKSIPLKEMFDYKKSTAWAIEKRLSDGNWNAWVAWKLCK